MTARRKPAPVNKTPAKPKAPASALTPRRKPPTPAATAAAIPWRCLPTFCVRPAPADLVAHWETERDRMLRAVHELTGAELQQLAAITLGLEAHTEQQAAAARAVDLERVAAEQAAAAAADASR